MVRSCGVGGEQWAGWSAPLSVDRVAKGLGGLERRRLRGRDRDGLTGLWVAGRSRGAAAGRELPEPGDGHRLAPREGVADGRAGRLGDPGGYLIRRGRGRIIVEAAKP